MNTSCCCIYLPTRHLQLIYSKHDIFHLWEPIAPAFIQEMAYKHVHLSAYLFALTVYIYGALTLVVIGGCRENCLKCLVRYTEPSLTLQTGVPASIWANAFPKDVTSDWSTLYTILSANLSRATADGKMLVILSLMCWESSCWFSGASFSSRVYPLPNLLFKCCPVPIHLQEINTLWSTNLKLMDSNTVLKYWNTHNIILARLHF